MCVLMLNVFSVRVCLKEWAGALTFVMLVMVMVVVTVLVLVCGGHV